MSRSRATRTTEAAEGPLIVDFEDNRLLARLFGEHDRHLARIERRLGVTVSSRGNRIAIAGPASRRETARALLVDLYRRLGEGHEVDEGTVEGALRIAEGTTLEALDEPNGVGDIVVRARRRSVVPRSPNQGRYLSALQTHDLVFGVGPAGTGKTYLAVGMAVSMLLEGRVERIVLARPAVEAGERLGFLPGDMREKIDPYLRPLFDALHDLLPAEQVARRIDRGEIEIAPLAFMRGRTLGDAFVIVDEAQNTTVRQMKMLLTRLGEGARMAVTGDPGQVDLPPGERSGLIDAVELLDGTEGVAVVRFETRDVVRHPMVARVLDAYAARDRKRRRSDEEGAA